MQTESLLRDVGVAILGAAAVGLPAYVLRVPLVIAYLAAGVMLGPHMGFSFIAGAESIETLSEMGLILLMFILGLEIDVRKLLQAGKAVLTNGVSQFIICFALGYGAFALFGFQVTSKSYDLIYLAMAVALSSTLVVVKILSDRFEIDTLTSRITLGILVMQDLWAIVFLAIQPNIGSLQWTIVLLSIAKALALIFAAWSIAKFILPRIYHRIGLHAELMLVVSMAWCLGTCGLADMLQLSLEMGALIAGITVASFPYHIDIASKISTLRDFFVTLFFVALGLQIQVPNGYTIGLALAIVGTVYMSRLLSVFPVLYLLRYGNRGSLVPALNLSQLSEFALVLGTLGLSFHHIQPDTFAAITLAVVISFLLSSYVIPKSYAVYTILNPVLAFCGFKDRIMDLEGSRMQPLKQQPPIVVLGFFREASSFLEEMSRRHPHNIQEQLMIVDTNPEAQIELKRRGFACKYADLSHLDTLANLNLQNSRIAVCTVPDHRLKGTSNLKLLHKLKKLYPNLHVIVTAETISSAREMYAKGADYVFVPRIIAATYLADLVDRMQTGNLESIRVNSKKFLDQRQEVLA